MRCAGKTDFIRPINMLKMDPPRGVSANWCKLTHGHEHWKPGGSIRHGTAIKRKQYALDMY